jgi:acetyltransferase-like isoleucine patch superfamily enzyme
LAHLLRRIRKKVLKRWARNAFFPGWRIMLLRWTGVDIGRDVYIADDFMIVEELSGDDRIVIGDRVSIAPRVTLVTSSHPNNSNIRSFAPLSRGPVTIEADAWIGAGAIVLPGVTIGKGAVVGAQSVVAASVDPLHVVAGQPARTIRVLTPPEHWS